MNDVAPPLDLTAARLAALAHPARLAILRHLAGRPACCCRDVVERMDLAQSTVSQHLKVLVDAGFVRFETDRRRSRYTVDGNAVASLAREVQILLACCRSTP